MKQQHVSVKLLRIEEAADILGIKVSSLYQKVWRREIEYVKLGRNVRFRSDSIERMIEDSTVPALEAR